MKLIAGIAGALLSASCFTSVAAGKSGTTSASTELFGCPSSSKPRFCVDAEDTNCCDLRNPDMSSPLCRCSGTYINGNLGKLYNEGDIVPYRVTASNARNSNVFLGADRSNQKNQLACYSGSDSDEAYNAQCNSGACGYSGIGGVTLNTALSTTDCSIKVGKPLCDARPDKKSTMWVQVVQVTGQRCVIDYYARVAIGAFNFPGSSLQAYFAYGGAQTISMNPADDGSGSSVGAEVSTALAVTRKQTQTWTVARSTDIADTYVPVCQTPTLYIKNNITYWPSGFEPLGDPVAMVTVNVTRPKALHAPRLRYEVQKMTAAGPVVVYARDVAQGDMDKGSYFKSEAVPLLGHADGTRFKVLATLTFPSNVGTVGSMAEAPVTSGNTISSLVTIRDTATWDRATGLVVDSTDKSQRVNGTLEFAMSTSGWYAYTLSVRMPDLDVNDKLDDYVRFYTGLTGYMTSSAAASSVHYVADQGGCDVPCRYGEWSDWGACQCGAGSEGTMKRTRVIARHAIGNGACDMTKLEESSACSTCPVDCKWAAPTCSATCTPDAGICGLGTATCTRTVASPALNGGADCLGPATFNTTCRVSCPCIWSWSEWGACSASCAGGSQFRSAQVTQVPDSGVCGPTPFTEERACESGVPCPVEGSWTAWADPTACSATCGGGQALRTRTCTNPAPAYGGLQCMCGLGVCATNGAGVRQETVTTACSTQACTPSAVNCEVSAWSAWSTCTKTCGAGLHTRTRTVVTQPANGGAACPALSETQQCWDAWCPEPCLWADPWETDGVCVGVCGSGQKKMIQYVANFAIPSDPACVDRFVWRPCTMSKPCPCTAFGDWSAWSACNVTCGTGYATRTRGPQSVCDSYNSVLQQTVECTTPCPADCTMTAWAEWGACTKSCGVTGGVRTRTRAIDQPALFGGQCTQALTETEACNVGVGCPAQRIPCELSKWSPWSPCSATCGTGQRTRTRTITNAAIMTTCDAPLTDAVSCSTPCPVACEWQWSEWSACTAECAPGGTHTRSAVLVQQATAGGACDYPGAVPVTEACNTASLCRTDCLMAPWSDWLATAAAPSTCAGPECELSQQCRSLCDATLTCGPDGVSVNNYLRDRTVETAPSNGGAGCGAARELCECPCTEEVTKKNPPYVAIGTGVGASAAAVIAGAGLLYMWMQSRKAAQAVAQFEADTLLVNGNEVNPLYQTNTMAVNNPIFDGQA